MDLAPHVVRRMQHVGVFLVFAVTAFALNAGPRAMRETSAADVRASEVRAGESVPSRDAAPSGAPVEDARWGTLRAAFGAAGVEERGALRIDLARPDLRVRVGGDALAARLALTGHVTFVPDGASDVRAEGEIVLLEREAERAAAEAKRRDVRVVALHDHLAGETPRVVTMHVTARGSASSVAARLRAVLADAAPPVALDADASPSPDDETRWSAIARVLGAPTSVDGAVASYTFPRLDRVTGHSTTESVARASFQSLGTTRVAAAGTFELRASELDAAVRASTAHGLHVTATDAGDVTRVHWFALGDADSIARGVAAVLGTLSRR